MAAATIRSIRIGAAPGSICFARHRRRTRITFQPRRRRSPQRSGDQQHHRRSGNQDIISDRSLSAMVYAWGQFIDHDLDLTPTGGTEPFNIQVPTGDPYFDPNSTGTQVIPTTRSVFDPHTGTSPSNPRQQVNTITGWLDGSMVYGSDAYTASALRTHSHGLMKTSAGADGVIGTTDDLLPFNNLATLPGGILPMANDSHLVPEDQLFAAGDVRANENIELTSLQTLFVREHNYWATEIRGRQSTSERRADLSDGSFAGDRGDAVDHVQRMAAGHCWVCRRAGLQRLSSRM